MNHRHAWGLAALLALGLQPAWASVVVGSPSVSVTQDDVVARVVPDRVQGAGGKTLYVLEGYSWANGGRIDAEMDPDPYIVAAVAALDFGTPSNLSFNFFLPIVPTTGPVTLKLTLAGSCTDSAASADGCSATPTLGGFLARGLLNGNVEIANGGAFSGAAGGSGSFASSTLSVTLPAAVTYNTLQLDLGFLGSGGGDAFSFTLGLEVLPLRIPEPGSLALVLASLGLAAAAGRRRPA